MDPDLFRDLDRALAREQEISERLDAYAAAHGRYPSDRELSDIEECAALRHPGGGCIAVLLCAVLVASTFVSVLERIL